MRRSAEPIPRFFARVIALSRWIFGPEMNVQVPPNLTEHYEQYLGAGINDWGGVSPLTIDWVNPDQPWPHLDELGQRTAGAGDIFDRRRVLGIVEMQNMDAIELQRCEAFFQRAPDPRGIELAGFHIAVEFG